MVVVKSQGFKREVFDFGETFVGGKKVARQWNK